MLLQASVASIFQCCVVFHCVNPLQVIHLSCRWVLGMFPGLSYDALSLYEFCVDMYVPFPSSEWDSQAIW